MVPYVSGVLVNDALRKAKQRAVEPSFRAIPTNRVHSTINTLKSKHNNEWRRNTNVAQPVEVARKSTTYVPFRRQPWDKLATYMITKNGRLCGFQCPIPKDLRIARLRITVCVQRRGSLKHFLRHPARPARRGGLQPG